MANKPATQNTIKIHTHIHTHTLNVSQAETPLTDPTRPTLGSLRQLQTGAIKNCYIYFIFFPLLFDEI